MADEKNTGSELIKTARQPEIIEKLNFFNPDHFATLQRVANLFASSELVPDMYRITPNNPKEKAIANCIIAIDMANRTGAGILMVMQNLVIVYGRPSWSSKFLISTVNTCGRFDPLQYKFEDLGPLTNVEYIEYEWDNKQNKKVPVTKIFKEPIRNFTCYAYTTSKLTGKILDGSPISIEMAIKEGWYTKSGSKWRTMPKQMLMYRAASFWTNAYAPDLSMGMKTEDEIRDIEEAEIIDDEIDTKANKEPLDIKPKEEEKKEEKQPKNQETEKKEPEQKQPENKKNNAKSDAKQEPKDKPDSGKEKNNPSFSGPGF